MANFKVVDLYDGSIQMAVPTSFIDGRYVAIYETCDQAGMIHHSSFRAVTARYLTKSWVHVNFRLGFELSSRNGLIADRSTFQPQ